MKTQAITAIVISVTTYITPAYATNASQAPWTGTLIDPNAPLIKGSELAQPADTYSAPDKFWSDDSVSKAFQGVSDRVLQAGQGVLHLQPQPKTVNVPRVLDPNTQEGQLNLNSPLQQKAQRLQQIRQQARQFTRPANADHQCSGT